MADIFEISGRIHSTSQEEVVTTSSEIIDEEQNNKKQSEINADVQLELNAHDEALNAPSTGLEARVETLEEQVAFSGDFQTANTPADVVSGSGKITTANAVAAIAEQLKAEVGYYQCTTAAGTAAKVIPASAAPNYVLTVGGSVKVKMTNKNTAANPTLKIGNAEAKPLYYGASRASSSNTWEAGEVIEVYYDGENLMANNVEGGGGDGVFDISAYNASGEPLAPSVYDNLTAALGTNGSNVPVGVRAGGMQVRFIQSSDNKYVQYMYMSSSTAAADFINVDNWQGVDDKPTSNSNNLVKSGGVQNAIEDVKLCIGDELDKTTQQGLLKWDGTIDTTTLQSSQFAKFELQSNSAKVFISGSWNYNSNYALFWVLDENENIIYKERFPGGGPLTYVYYGLALPQDAAFVYVNNALGAHVYSYKELYPTIKNLEINSGQAQQDITDIQQDITDIQQDITDIQQDISLEEKLNYDSRGTGFLKNDGTIDTSIWGGNYNIFNLPENINKFYLTASEIIVTPNRQWSLLWIADSDGNCLNSIPAVSDNVPNVSKLLIDISDHPTATKIYITKCASCYLEYFGSETISERVSELDTRVTNLDTRVTNLENAEELNSINQWKGKKIVWLGTSIPYGQSAADGGRAVHPYPSQIADKLGCTVINNASPGLAVEGDYDSDTGIWTPKSWGSLSLTATEYMAAGQSSPGVKCYENSMLGQNADLYVFDCEPNNSNADITILNSFNVNTWAYIGDLAGSTLADHRDCYVGCLLYLLDKLWTEKPDAKVVFVGEHTSCTDFSQNYAMSAASAALAQKLRIPYIDLADKLYYNKFNVSLYVNSDKIHPTQAGHDRIAKILANELTLIA